MNKKFNFILLYILAIILFSIDLFALGRKDLNTENIYENNHQLISITNKEDIMPLPIYISELPNINDYTLFANGGGWDGNWYIGFNLCWIERLPPAPVGNYLRAYIGAKIGRMKTRQIPGKPIWEKEPIPGDIYISISSTPAWKANQSFFLVNTIDIPLEGEPDVALNGVGEARWFWVEVPLNIINFEGENYVAIWSPTPYFVSTASSPILAGGWGSKKVNTWLNNDIRGYPPLNPKESLKTSIIVYEPAIAIKLIPENTFQDIRVLILESKKGRENTEDKTLLISVQGDQIERVWIEISNDGNEWKKIGRYLWSPPYMFTLQANLFNEGDYKIRACASDIWGNIGYSTPLEIKISR